MKVYLVYGLDLDDSCEEPFVKKVFANKRKALDYVIKQYYSDPFYSKMNPDWLDDNARPNVVETEVE
ncbi:hypothetical protein CCP3SC1AL1_3830002 [Gammaproteobacteria bacterium]